MGGHKFDGTNTKTGTIAVLPEDNYTIEIKLLDKDFRQDFNFTKSTPPMPANIGGWALIKTKLNSYFVYNSDLRTGSNISFNLAEKNTIKIEADAAQEETRFYLNGEFVSRKSIYNRLKSFYRLGVGYDDRTWKGEIKYVRVFTNKDGQIVPLLDI